MKNRLFSLCFIWQRLIILIQGAFSQKKSSAWVSIVLREYNRSAWVYRVAIAPRNYVTLWCYDIRIRPLCLSSHLCCFFHI